MHFPRQSIISKFIFIPIFTFIFFGSLLLNFNIFYQKSFLLLSPKIPFQKRLPCLLRTQIHFQRAFELQNQGLAILRHLNGKMNLRATWELIPRHFNGIWENEFQNLDILRLQSDSEEKKYFIKFSRKFSRPYLCHVVTLGVGHSIWAERNLSKIYPECHFLAVDPAWEINADLVQNELGGTFVKAAIGGKTKTKTMMNVWGKDVERKGVQRRMMPQMGIFEFVRKYHPKMDPIDLLLVDVEGAEFGILEQFVENSNHFPAPICQINVEIHHPNELNPKYTHRRFFRYFDRLIRGRHFALLHVDIHNDSRYLFLRLFLVNIADEICIRKFLC